MIDFSVTMEIDLDTLEEVSGGAKPDLRQDALAGCLDGASGNHNLVTGCVSGAGKRLVQDLGKLLRK